MSKNIIHLVDDIYALLEKKASDPEFLQKYESTFVKYAMSMVESLKKSVTNNGKNREPNKIYPSEIGKKCMRQVWFNIWHPEKAKPLDGKTLHKFLYGDMLEASILALAEMSGHKVELRQGEVKAEFNLGETVGTWTLSGRIDCVIDGELVDVKTASRIGFAKFVSGKWVDDDPFGYARQLMSYGTYGVKGETGTHFFKEGRILAICKETGDIHLTNPITIDSGEHCTFVGEVLAQVFHKRIKPPVHKTATKTCMECKYCPYHSECWG